MRTRAEIGHVRIVVFGVLLGGFAVIMSTVADLPLAWAIAGSALILVFLVAVDRYFEGD